MSEYGRIWEQIQSVREQLAVDLGITRVDVCDLPTAIRLAAEHKKRIDLTLANWAELEAKAAKLDSETGNPP